MSNPTRKQPWVFLGGVLCLIAAPALVVYTVRNQPDVVEPDIAAEAEADLASRNFRPLSAPLEALVNDPTAKTIPTQAHPLLGHSAPDFTLQDTAGQATTLSALCQAGPVVVVFYYGYHCNHCVSQLFALDKDYDQFRELGATIVAISADPSADTLARFKKYGAFRFPVLTDPGNVVAKEYGTYTPSKKPNEEGELMHGTFVITPAGKIVWSNRGDSPFTDNRTLLIELHRTRR